MLALDQPTKSIVVAVRGTMSVADMATDLLADPAPMDDWLPHSMTQVHRSGLYPTHHVGKKEEWKGGRGAPAMPKHLCQSCHAVLEMQMVCYFLAGMFWSGSGRGRHL